jgi:hypothetical protein
VFGLPNEGPKEVHTKHTKPAIFRKEVTFLGPVYLGNNNKNVAAILNNCSKRSKSRKKPAKNCHKIVQNDIMAKDLNV